MAKLKKATKKFAKKGHLAGAIHRRRSTARVKAHAAERGAARPGRGGGGEARGRPRRR
jgi:hypothetical protein